MPALPPMLKSLIISNTEITSIPELPPSLDRLFISDTAIKSLPPLPVSLKNLLINTTKIIDLPELPVGIEALSSINTPLAIPYIYRRAAIDPDGNLITIEGETAASYNARCWEIKTRVGRAIKAELAARLSA